jgi:hypothetical protein
MDLSKPSNTPRSASLRLPVVGVTLATIVLMSRKQSKPTNETPKRSRKRDKAEEAAPRRTNKQRAAKKPPQPVRTDTEFGAA